MLKILILGYYHRHNLGDDLFEVIFKQILSVHQLTFANADQLDQIPNDTNLIICGGGDLINDYFMKEINRLVDRFYREHQNKLPIYAIGVGFPYPQLITEDYLKVFDLILTRNQAQITCHNRIYTIPDLVTLLPVLQIKPKKPKRCPISCFNSQTSPLSCLSPQVEIAQLYGIQKSRKQIGVFLARPLYSDRLAIEVYKKLLEKLSVLITELIQTTKNNCQRSAYYQIHLLAMNTHQPSVTENDQLINQDLFDLIEQTLGYQPRNLSLHNSAIDPAQVLELFGHFDLTIVTRYHAHILSILTNTPFVSLACTRKVNELLASTGLSPLSIGMTIDPETLAPTDFNLEKARYLIYQLLPPPSSIFKSLGCLNRCLNNTFDEYINGDDHQSDDRPENQPDNQSDNQPESQPNNQSQSDPISLPLRLPQIRQRFKDIQCHWQATPIIQQINNLLYYQPRAPTSFQIQKRTQSLAEILSQYLKTTFNLTLDSKSLMERGLSSIANHLTGKENNLSQIISFNLIQRIESEYNWGLSQQILTPEWRLSQTVDWILRHHYHHQIGPLLHNPTKHSNRIFNLGFFDDENLEGLHRSGWPWIMSHLRTLHNPEGLLFDPFLDKTFGWRRDFYLKLGHLPLTKPWTGIFHHTPNTEYTDYNLTRYFQDPLLFASLEHCQALIVFSTYLKEWIQDRLQALNFRAIPIHVLKHPAEIPPPELTFVPEQFQNNPTPKVIQIGAWLRDTYAIYDLPELDFLTKAVLRGKKMDNYFPPDSHQNQIIDHVCTCRAENNNKYLDGLQKAIIRHLKSVEVIEYLSNDEYDQLLTKNVIFLKLIDASAVNTLIEAIVRNTPIVVNPVTAVIEYLGPDYPLYYQNLGQAAQLLNDSGKLLAGHQYLKLLDKEPFTIETFMTSLIRSFLQKSLNP